MADATTAPRVLGMRLWLDTIAGGMLDGGTSSRVLHEISRAGIDLAASGDEPRKQGTDALVKSWDDLMLVIEARAKVT